MAKKPPPILPADFSYIFQKIGPATDDRTLAIICNAYLELYLEHCLRQRLHLNSDLADRLFGTRGILFSQSARIDMATALGMIDGDFRNDLIVLNQIRNRFAHHLHVDSLDDPEIVKLTDTLRYPVLDRAKMMEQMKEKDLTSAQKWEEFMSSLPLRWTFTSTFLRLAQRLTRNFDLKAEKIMDSRPISYSRGDD